MNRIYLSPPDVRLLEREFINAAIESNWVAPVGPDLDAFEAEVAEVTGVSEAVGLVSGTAALHLAMLDLGVGKGDYVFVPSLTFIATANAVAYAGGTPVFIDSEPETWNICPSLVVEELETRNRNGTLPKAAIVVDLYGQCANYGPLLAAFAKYSVPVVEDAAEALGATHEGRPAGSFGHCGVVSFNGNKIITSGGGGMLLSNNPMVVSRARYLASQARQEYPFYQHVDIGYNYRLSNILAAFGRGQLLTLPERIARRKYINAAYERALSKLSGFKMMPISKRGTSNYWLTCIVIDPTEAGLTAEELRAHLDECNIEARPTWKPLHLQPVFHGAPNRINGTSADIFSSGLCLPSGSGMSDQELEYVIESIIARVRG